MAKGSFTVQVKAPSTVKFRVAIFRIVWKNLRGLAESNADEKLEKAF